MSGRFEGKVAFITGAARGQGRNHAIRLAQEGADIIALDAEQDLKTVPYPQARTGELAQTVAAVEATGRRIHAEIADVRDLASVQRVVDAGVAKFGRLDVVSANAGILSFGQAHELDEDRWGEMIDINLTGVWRTVRAATPHMIAAGNGGAVVITSSVAGLRSYENVGHYVASKHGLIGLMKTLAQELAPHRIRVNTLNPTQVDTDMVQNDAMYQVFCPDVENPTRDDFAVTSGGMIKLPIPWVEVDDVTNALMFLASDDARYITGVALPVDGGALLV